MLDALTPNTLEDCIERAGAWLEGVRQPDGHLVFELESDVTIPSEYVLLMHYLDEIDDGLAAEIGRYIRRIQADHGGWALYHDGAFDISASVKAYFALKAIGDAADAPHMVRAREAILAAGGAARTNVFTRFQLALFGFVPWRATPAMPVELVLLPATAPFSIWKVSYWSRTVTVPLLVLAALRPLARNPRGVRIDELFVVPPEQVRDWHSRSVLGDNWKGRGFRAIDAMLRPAEKLIPRATRQKAIDAAVGFVTERLNGVDGLGAIYPAMANSVMMFDALGVGADDPRAATARESLRRLLVRHETPDGVETYCQPCVSPVWDTALAGHAVLERAQEGGGRTVGEAPAAVGAANEWLLGREVRVRGDWSVAAPDLAPGGWAFQYRNDHYPDVDDTAVVGMLMHRSGDPATAAAVERARVWILGMQSANGGWGAFDIDNNTDFLNYVPFADHGALLDPPTADVTARCISFLCQLGHAEDRPSIERGLAWLRSEQEADGAWFGRWGTNYIYGTWSVLCALNAAGLASDDPAVVRAAEWLVSVQNEDGGWGEGQESYDVSGPRGTYRCSLPSQTAWAVLGLMAAGRVRDEAVSRGVAWLAAHQTEAGSWDEPQHNAVGFPRVFYLRYHGYRHYFPLMALSRFRNLSASNSARVGWGF